MSDQKSQTAEEAQTDSGAIPMFVFDYRDFATWGILPGFYWALGVDQNGEPISEDEVEGIIGPYDTKKDAEQDAQQFILDAINSVLDAGDKEDEA